MGNSDEGKNQKSSLWTTTIDKEPLPTNQDIKKAIQNIKDNNIDINKPSQEIENLIKIFKPEK